MSTRNLSEEEVLDLSVKLRDEAIRAGARSTIIIVISNETYRVAYDGVTYEEMAILEDAVSRVRNALCEHVKKTGA